MKHETPLQKQNCYFKMPWLDAYRKPVSTDDWPTYSSEHPNVFYLTDKADVVIIGHGLRTKQCAFWNEMIPAIKTHKCSI